MDEGETWGSIEAREKVPLFIYEKGRDDPPAKQRIHQIFDSKPYKHSIQNEVFFNFRVLQICTFFNFRVLQICIFLYL